MAENHQIEKNGRKILEAWLTANGRVWSKSDDKTFDLIVDGQYAELKTKRHPVRKFDFFFVSEKQQAAIRARKPYVLFLVCNIDDPANAEIFEIPFEVLASFRVKSEVHYYYDKSCLGDLNTFRQPSIQSASEQPQ